METKTRAELLAPSYYSRKDIQEAIFNFCKNRETIPNYNNKFFGKRPDCLDYPSDIPNMARKGATSFHCSEELWRNVLDIKTGMSAEEYNELRIGWDLLIDIDSKYFDYSKIAARLLINALEYHGVKNIGIKFSGSKGLHIIVPFKAFPKEIAGKPTKDQFPEWARIIARYLIEFIKDELNKEILKTTPQEELEKQGKQIFEIKCKICGNPAFKKEVTKYVCPNIRCKAEITTPKKHRKQILCPSCNTVMEKAEVQEIFYCDNCGIDSLKKPELFEKEITTKELIDSVDIVLVSPRHLFRAPYSLHEKTALASIVIPKEDLDSFKPSDADPLKIKTIRNFLPNSEEGEAKELFVQALDWHAKKNQTDNSKKEFTGEKITLKGLKITEEMFPKSIKELLKGIKGDGRKRALSILLPFLTSLELPEDFISEIIYKWNSKNYQPLRESYIRSQISWHLRNKRLPPNYDKPIYCELIPGFSPEQGIKNPINYTIKLALKQRKQSKTSRRQEPSARS